MLGSKFGIKSKVVIAIISIVTLTTAFNLYYTFKTFKADKEAYVFDSAQRASDAATEKISLFLNPIISNLQKKLVDQELASENIKLYLELSNEKLIFGKHHENYNLEKDKLTTELYEKLSALKDGISYIEYESLILFSIKKDSIIRSALLDLDDLKEGFNKDGIFSYKIDLAQVILQDSKEIDGVEIDFIGTKIFKDFLIAKSENKSLSVQVISFISTEKAFSILQVILIKNISFAAIILGLCLILALYASNKFTGPILRIISKTDEIAKGNYDSELDIRTNDELRHLGTSVNSMSSKIKDLLADKEEMIKQLEIANQKLDDYNKNLEQKVQERTKELKEANDFIKTMINSLNQGLFVFGKDKKAKDIYTNACIELFDTNPANKDISEILKLGDSEKESFDKWSEIVFSNMLPFSSAKALGPKSFIVGTHGEENFKHVELNYFSMDDEEGNLQNIVAVATDKTIEINAQEAFKKKDLYVSMITKLVKDKDSFMNLFNEAKNMLRDLKENLGAQKLSDKAMIVFHTMNGGFAAYSAMELTMKARASEELIKTFKGTSEEFKHLVEKLIAEYNELMASFYNDTILSLFSSKNVVEIEKEELKTLENNLKKISSEAYSSFNEIINKKRVGKFFDSYSNLISSLSEKLDKPMMPLIVNDNGLRITPEPYNEYFSSLVHLFRNCMDHGIENQETRSTIGKEEKGIIKVDIEKEKEHLKISIKDDGAGLNLEKIKEKLMGMMDQKEVKKMSQDELCMAIFLPNFSTKDAVSELSGRGIGMSAIKEAVDKLSGKLEIKTTSKRGSEFNFTLPLL